MGRSPDVAEGRTRPNVKRVPWCPGGEREEGERTREGKGEDLMQREHITSQEATWAYLFFFSLFFPSCFFVFQSPFSLSVFLSFLLSPLYLSLLFLSFSHLLSVNLYGCPLLVVAVSLNVVSRMRIPRAPRTETSSAGVLSNDYGRGNFSIRQSGTTCYLIGTGARVYVYVNEVD